MTPQFADAMRRVPPLPVWGLTLLVVGASLGTPLSRAAAQWSACGSGDTCLSSGRAGIGTTTPDAPLTFAPTLGEKIRVYQGGPYGLGLFGVGGKALTSLYGSGAYQSAGVALGMYDGMTFTPALTVDYYGQVGIGTTSPTGKLQIQDATGQSVHLLALTADATTQTSDLVTLQSGSQSPGYALFRIDNGATFGTSVVYVRGDGHVGIGSASPTSQLYVVGDITATGNLAAKYQDVAEWVPARRPLEPGTVVVLDPDRANSVRPSIYPYDTTVAGVVSAQPGLLLGEAGDHKVKVATTGRVKVKAQATHGPIQVGDLLVTSDAEGLAMRSEPLDLGGVPLYRPGTVLGKALEPLEQGQGDILVLLTLQ